MANILQKLVSKKKRRFQEDGFDLDMTFITKNIVAMGYPSEKLEGVFRNKMSDVKRFFDSRHEGHYKVYNLCSERCYDASKFYHRVANYPFDDHNAPPFVMIQPFCEDVHKYLTEDERNVAVIHCKAGKGRTGVMICAYLVHCGMWKETSDALDFYGHARTKNGKGVTIPSQVRYVQYYGQYVNQKLQYKSIPLLLTKITMHGLPNFSGGTCVPQFIIRQGPNKEVIYKSRIYEALPRDKLEIELPLDRPVPLCDDIKIEFLHKKATGSKEKMFHMWFNTFFVENKTLVLQKSTIDKANKDKKHKIFASSFAVEFSFEDVDSEVAAHYPIAASAQLPAPAPLPRQGSTVSAMEEYISDCDLTTDDEEDEPEEYPNLPVADV